MGREFSGNKTFAENEHACGKVNLYGLKIMPGFQGLISLETPIGEGYLEDSHPAPGSFIRMTNGVLSLRMQPSPLPASTPMC